MALFEEGDRVRVKEGADGPVPMYLPASEYWGKEGVVLLADDMDLCYVQFDDSQLPNDMFSTDQLESP